MIDFAEHGFRFESARGSEAGQLLCGQVGGAPIGGIEFERAQFGCEQVTEGLPIRFSVDCFFEGDGDVFSTDSFEPQCVANFDSPPSGEGGLVVHEGAGVALLVDELFVLEALEYPFDEVGVDVGGAEFLL